MKSFVLALAVAFAATFAASPASAFFRITTVACDTVGTNPLQVRTVFNVDLVGPGGYCWFEMTPKAAGPGPADSTHFYAAIAPAGWHASSDRLVGFARDGQQCFGTGDHFEGFQIITNRAGPCAHFYFTNGLLFSGEDDASGDGCMILDGPVPARGTTWGQLKAVYRR